MITLHQVIQAIGQRYKVDLEKAMWAWVAERRVEAAKHGARN